jgi:lysocardiolipin and lysophospholipid acyltransferase
VFQALYELWLGVKVIIHGQPAPIEDSVLILCNHRTRLDWLFLMSYQLRCGALSHYRISLKAALKSIPGPGLHASMFQDLCFYFSSLQLRNGE